jgi:hypothetical protein
MHLFFFVCSIVEERIDSIFFVRLIVEDRVQLIFLGRTGGAVCKVSYSLARATERSWVQARLRSSLD